jgi:hypothetical protein
MLVNPRSLWYAHRPCPSPLDSRRVMLIQQPTEETSPSPESSEPQKHNKVARVVWHVRIGLLFSIEFVVLAAAVSEGTLMRTLFKTLAKEPP